MAVWAIGATGSMARADGLVLPPVLLPQDVEMPDQRALLAWRDGMETLVIESAFVGKGTDFAWVVPLPAKPAVEAATRGTLPSVAALLLPVVIPPVKELWLLVAAIAGVSVLALLTGWRVVGWIFRAGLMILAGLIIGGVLTALIAPAYGLFFLPAAVVLACWMGRKLILQEASLFSHLILLIAGLLLFGMMIPTFGTVRGTMGGTPEAGRVLVERKIVGDFDVAILSGKEGASVADWLQANGFSLPEPARAVAVEHAEAGGWFVASRVRRAFVESGRNVPAPLVFRFPAERPVYPMRFTGAGATRALEVELFVFGPERAVAEGLEPVAWGPVQTGDPREGVYRRGTGQPHGGRVVTHPELRRLTEGTAIVTRLRGTLAPQAMQADIHPRWEAGGTAAHGLVAYAEESLWQVVLGGAGGVLLLGMIVVGFYHQGEPGPWRWRGVVLGMALATGALLFGCLPSVAVREAKGGIPGYERRRIPQVAALVLGELDPAKTTDAQVREAFAGELKKFLGPADWAMPIGDGPGEVDLVKQPDGRWRVYLYDTAGQARFDAEDDITVGSLRAGEGETK
jgi:hypothetical protein